jgi:M6 family metalloprotease-like protein
VLRVRQNQLDPGATWMRKAIAIVTMCFGGIPSAVAAQTIYDGILTVVWEDPSRAGSRARLMLYLTQDNGSSLLLEVDQAMAQSTNWMALNGQSVRVSGHAAPLERVDRPGATVLLRAVSVSPIDIQIQATAQSAFLPPVTGNQPFATILCRSVDFPLVPHEPAWYQTLMQYPGFGGMDHYFRENSYGAVSLLGSEVFGWFDLGKPRSAYWVGGDSTRYDHPLMAQDCARVADASVDFNRFVGVNLQFSFNAPASWGGSSWITADGRASLYRTTWLASWASRHVYAHEIFHTFGLPHSSGPYELTYDSKWDVMSAHAFYDAGLADWVGHHTIGAHKDQLGWVPPGRKHSPQPGTVSTLELDALASGPGHLNTLLIEVPLVGSPNHRYTVEARRAGGYDGALPGNGLVVHKVHTRCFGLADRCARVFDVDNNGDVNDDGAIWTPGEIFADSINGLFFRVGPATATGYEITVTRGWPLTLMSSLGGRIVSGTIECVETTCSSVLALPQTNVQLMAQPNAGFQFVDWRGDCNGTSLTCTVAVTSERTVQARFGRPIAFVTESPRPGLMGKQYADTLRAIGGIDSTIYRLVDGQLPPGLALDSVSGLIAGVPALAGRFSLRVKVLSGPFADERDFEIDVSKPVLAEAAVLDQLLGTGNTLTADEVRFLDLLGNSNQRLDVGDVRAWLIDSGKISAANHLAGRPVADRSP